MKAFTLSIPLLFVAAPLAVNAKKKCKDDNEFTFQTEFVGKVNCDWLSQKESRQDKYCDSRGWDDDEEKKVKYACKDTCSDFLTGDQFLHCHSDVPSSVPSAAPSDEESKKCKDDKRFEFETEWVGLQDCSWISEKAKRKYKYCETRGWDDKAELKVKYACRRSCANFLEGDQFDKCAKYEDDDYVEYGRDANNDDNGTDCKNEKNFKFKTEFVGNVKCSWLEEKEDRIEKYCEGRGWDGLAEKKVKYACKAACGC